MLDSRFSSLPEHETVCEEELPAITILLKRSTLLGELVIELARRVRAFNPWPVAWCTIGGERTRIWAARALPDPDPAPAGTVGQADAAGIVVATGRGRLVLLQLQRPGARPVSAAEYLNAGSLPPRLAAAP